MTCYHPLRAVCDGVNENGKRKLHILKHGDPELNIDGLEYLSIPCGKCIGCRLEYSKNWADRCMLEAMYHDKNSFITLTYDDDHLPPANPVFDSDGVFTGLSPIHPLVKSDFQKFMKRLRFHFGDEKLRYFASGEYGSVNMRPHYHAIIFGEDFSDDRRCISKNVRSEPYYISDTLSQLWPYGFHTVCNVSWNTAAYVARYCVKKRKGNEASVYKDLNFTPEFTLMSRKPGIGREYYDDHKKSIYKNQEIFLALPDRSLKIRPSRYYDSLYDIDEPSHMAAIRDSRRLSSDVRRSLKYDLSSLKFLDQLEVDEYNQLQRTKILNERRCDL